MKQRLIDVDLAIAKVEPDEYYHSNEVKAMLLDMPTVDAVPVVHGRWADRYKSGYKPTRGAVCTECDCWNERTAPFCPNCGARMDGQEDAK